LAWFFTHREPAGRSRQRRRDFRVSKRHDRRRKGKWETAGLTFATAKPPKKPASSPAWRWWRGQLSARWRTRTKSTAGHGWRILQPKRAMTKTTNSNLLAIYQRQAVSY